jgi:hypothetical protein
VVIGVSGGGYGPPATAQPKFLSSTFAGVTENPSSLGGNLIHPADLYTSYQKTRITPGKLYGVAASAGYDDCVVHTNPFLGISNTQHYVKAVCHRAGGYSPGNTHEVELVVLVRTTPTSLKLYECLWPIGGAISPVRWNGTIGDFVLHGTGNWTDTPTVNTSFSNLQHGDVAEMYVDFVSGSPRLTIYVNGTMIFQCQDTSVDKLTHGQPGWSFFARADAGLVLDSYCWSSIEAGNWTSLP